MPKRGLLSSIPPWARVLLVFGFLYVFLLGIGAMGGGFKTIGKGYTKELLGSAEHPLVALFIGILATTLVQSSSTTTSMVVALVAVGQIQYSAGVFMVMGANVGTTVTNTLVSLGHIRHSAEYKRAFAAATVHDFFNLIVLCVLFPIEWATSFLDKLASGAAEGFQNVGGTKLASPIKKITKPVINELKAMCEGLADWANSLFGTDFFGSGGGILVIVGILLTFLALVLLVKTLKTLMVEKLENLFDRVIFRSPFRGLMFGIALTILVQSSSITTSVAVPLVGAGILTIRQVLAYTMGANIGTTVTAVLASLAALAAVDASDPAAFKKAFLGVELAFHHVLFNIIGVAGLWWFREIPIRIAEAFATIAMRNRLIPLVYILVVFYIIPFVVVILAR